jgi:integrase
VLKTEEETGDAPRRVPVHPVLAELLARWREGFELLHCTKPAPGLPIVPRLGLGHHTKSTAYKMWRKSCAEVGVTNRSLHATRHTFISYLRRGGVASEDIEVITHNAGGTVVDAR